jgi:hypothetical protein
VTLLERDEWDDDLVIYFLDGRKNTEESASAREHLAKIAAETFGCLNKAQAEAIFVWLRAIAGKSCVELCRPDYESAIEFWTGRVRALGGTVD